MNCFSLFDTVRETTPRSTYPQGYKDNTAKDLFLLCSVLMQEWLWIQVSAKYLNVNVLYAAINIFRQ